MDVDQPPPRTFLENLVRTSRRTIDENCAAFERTAARHGEKATLSPRQLWRWMAGAVDHARPVAQRVAELHRGHPFAVLLGPPEAVISERPLFEADDRGGPGDLAALGHLVVAQVERLRQGIHDAVATSSMSEASLDEWDETVLRHGQATRYRPTPLLLGELAADFAELERVMTRRHAAQALRRLTRTTAQMAGLMFLTLIRLNEPLAARNWARTARVAADEAGDPAIRAWVRAQEAYVHYYAGNLAEALTVARQAQVLAGQTPCVAVPLAAALEARALAVMGRGNEARSALGRAEAAVGVLEPDALIPSAFGYNEAQMRFHQGNALTHLHDSQGAFQAQDRALVLYPTSDYLDRTLLELDRAHCLAYDGDATGAMTHAGQLLADLTDDQRSGLILLRGSQVFETLTKPQRALPSARDFRDLLVQTADLERIQPPC